MVSPFTKVSLKGTQFIIGENFLADIPYLFNTCLITTYSTWPYKQIKGEAMKSPLSPAVANLFKQRLTEQALSTTKLKRKTWLRYVDDTFVVWEHDTEN